MAAASMVVEIGAETSRLSKGLADAASKLTGFGETAQNIGSGLTKWVTGPIVGAGAAAVASVVGVGNLADELLDLVDQTGLSAESLQEFRHVARVAGVDSDTLANAAIKLTSGLSGSGEESKSLSDAIGELGLSARDSTGKLRPMDELFPGIIKKLQGMEDVTHRNALMADIFGKSWKDLAPVVAMGADGMADAQKEARDLGLVLSTESLESADKFRRQLDTLKAVLGANASQIGLKLIPIMTDMVKIIQTRVLPMVEGFVTWLGKLVNWYEKLSPGMQTAVLAIAGFAAAIGPVIFVLGTLASSMGSILMLFGTSFPAVIARILPFLGPAGLIVAGLAAVFLVWKNWDQISELAKRVYTAVQTWIGDKLAKVLEFVKNPIQGVTNAFRDMWDKVVGHSYVPDMVNGIQREFARLDAVMVQPTLAGTSKVTAAFGAAALAARDSYIAQRRAAEEAAAGAEAYGLKLQTVTVMSRQEYAAMAKASQDALEEKGVIGSVNRLIERLGENGLGASIVKLADQFTGGKFTGAIQSVVDRLSGPLGVVGSVAKVVEGLTGTDLGNAVKSFVNKLIGAGSIEAAALAVVAAFEKVLEWVKKVGSALGSSGFNAGGGINIGGGGIGIGGGSPFPQTPIPIQPVSSGGGGNRDAEIIATLRLISDLTGNLGRIVYAAMTGQAERDHAAFRELEDIRRELIDINAGISHLARV